MYGVMFCENIEVQEFITAWMSSTKLLLDKQVSEVWIDEQRPHHSLTERYKWLAFHESCAVGDLASLGSLLDHFCECLVSAPSSVAL